MLTTKIDLTKLCTLKQIQYILWESEEYKGNILLKDLFYREQIIKYVLANLNHRHMTIEDLREIPIDSSDILPECPLEEQSKITILIRTKMSEIVRQLLEAEAKTNTNKVEELK